MLAFDSPKPTYEGEYGYGPSVTVDIWSTQHWTVPHSPNVFQATHKGPVGRHV
ncbi:hypothetical protein EMPG_13644 [Blastomyces silverae]|uniref:Uncharacterized protein n=1 Tax=Blastomyces silverae TaxID=2060906 RepID=A0A0H1BI93_9EURO|nr:hypothetical protein EMPG_13644 [Blastomyces silverae]